VQFWSGYFLGAPPPAPVAAVGGGAGGEADGAGDALGEGGGGGAGAGAGATGPGGGAGGAPIVRSRPVMLMWMCLLDVDTTPPEAGVTPEAAPVATQYPP
jgi:hypothetical protein